MCDDGLSARSHLTNPIRLHFSDHLLSACAHSLETCPEAHKRFAEPVLREVDVYRVTFEFNGLTCGNAGSNRRHVLREVRDECFQEQRNHRRTRTRRGPRGGARGARVVVIPDFGQGLDTLERNIEQLEAWGVPYLIDPVIEPIGFGFMASLERYAEVRRRYPQASQLMGIGNITELTSADTTGVHAVLLAICEELGVKAVLTTEVIPWARGAVREIDIARRLMHHAVSRPTIPKGVDDRRPSSAGSTRQ